MSEPKELLMSNLPMVTNDFRALCAKVIAYYEGQGEYNFMNLNSNDRDNAAFDAWVNLSDEIKSALAATANDRLISAKLAVAQPPPALEPVAWCQSDDFNDAAKKRQSFSGWREKWHDCDMALYIYPVTIKEDQL